MYPLSPIDLLAPLLTDPPDLSATRNDESWSEIAACAGRYGVAPWVAYTARGHLSPTGRNWCDRVLTDSWARHERMLRHLEYVTGLFDAAAIRAVSLKGPLLARRYYNPPFVRKPSMDLDIGVAEGDLEHACKILMEVGYTLDKPLAEARTRSHHVELSNPSRPKIELHFRLSHMALGLPIGEFIDRSMPFALPNGKEARVLFPADQLFHLILHLAQSRFGTLFHLAEIRRVSRAESPEVLEDAVRLAIRHHCCAVFRMLDIAFRARWGEPFLPPGIQLPATWLDRRLTPRLYRDFERWAEPGRALNLPARLHGRWLDFQLTDRPVDAWRALIFFVSSVGFYLPKRAWGGVRHTTYAAPTPAPVAPDGPAAATKAE